MVREHLTPRKKLLLLKAEPALLELSIYNKEGKQRYNLRRTWETVEAATPRKRKDSWRSRFFTDEAGKKGDSKSTTHKKRR